MWAEKRLAVLRDLSLKGKVTLTLALAFLATVALVLAVLLPLEKEQHVRSLEQNKRLLSTLRDKYQRDFIHDIVSENEESTVIDLADMARQQGILWVRLDADPIRLEATADRRAMELLMDGELPDGAGAGEPIVLVVRKDGTATVLGASGRPLVSARAVHAGAWPAWRADPTVGDSFREVQWGGAMALHSVAPLSAAGETYGRLSVAFSTADLQRVERRTRLAFYGGLATAFVLLVVLLNLLISHIVLAPVQRVMDAMRQASRGEMRVRLPVHSRDEIGSMAESFNTMVGELEVAKGEIEGYSRNLERMVEERTRELRASEETLRAVKNHLATVIANVATGVLSLDEEGRVTTFNGRAAEILGLAAAEAEGRAIDALLAEGERRRLLEFIARVRDGGPSVRKGQVQMKLAEGLRTLSVVASPLVGDGSRRLGTVVVFDDVTQILATQRLTAWKEAVDRVIHEIKNPLTPIGLTAQTLRSAFEQDRARFEGLFPSAVQIILDSVRDLKALISEFAQFSRLPEVLLRRVDLNELVSEVVAPYAQGEGVRVRAELAGGPLAVEADPTQFRRVLLNVINNGIEAMEGRSGEIVVTTRGPDRAGRVGITVRDRGCGVEDVERIFEPYYTTKVKGTGLGLAIARQIVDEHGGDIRAESELGVGTTVTIRLPEAH
jgi:PAS domain S-box-containing protein